MATTKPPTSTPRIAIINGSNRAAHSSQRRCLLLPHKKSATLADISIQSTGFLTDTDHLNTPYWEKGPLSSMARARRWPVATSSRILWRRRFIDDVAGSTGHRISGFNQSGTPALNIVDSVRAKRAMAALFKIAPIMGIFNATDLENAASCGCAF